MSSGRTTRSRRIRPNSSWTLGLGLQSPDSGQKLTFQSDWILKAGPSADRRRDEAKAIYRSAWDFERGRPLTLRRLDGPSQGERQLLTISLEPVFNAGADLDFVVNEAKADVPASLTILLLAETRRTRAEDSFKRRFQQVR